ncbi:MAG TPA: ATP-binding protein [Solirubrobacteraceae bacterium]|nr:ATP-binding protein [Solirubrobacteraceae bacterium]
MPRKQSDRTHRSGPRRPQVPRAFASDLGRLEAVFVDLDWPEGGGLEAARTRARERAYVAFVGHDAVEPDERWDFALRLAAAELIRSATVEGAAVGSGVADMVAAVEEVIDDSTLELAVKVLRSPELMMLAPPLAVSTQLLLLAAFGRLRCVSLWMSNTTDHVECAARAGEAEPSRATRILAQTVLAGERPEAAPRKLLIGLPVGRHPQPVAALVGTAQGQMRGRAQRLMSEAAPLLGAVLERDALLTNNAESERSLVQSSERKLTRLGFDLHDGPIQDVAVLAEDVRLLERQIQELVKPASARALVKGRLEDVEAQLVAIDGELRRLSGEVNSASVLLNRSFEAALRDRMGLFVLRSGIEPNLTLSGSLHLISASQQIALLNIIHECLSNIREHAAASVVDIAVSVGARGINAEIRDDGQGFDLESTLMRAAREGRMGLLAMHERVRLLGGQCRIQSVPGGGTVVSVALDLWEPLLASEPAESQSSAAR